MAHNLLVDPLQTFLRLSIYAVTFVIAFHVLTLY